MDIVDYDVIKNDNKILIFLKVIDYPSKNGKLSYKTLGNIIYEMTDGSFCVTDKRGVPLVIRDTIQLCEDFLRKEFVKKHNVKKQLVLDTNEN